MSSPPPSIFDRPLMRTRNDVSLSFFAFLFSEVVQYSMTQTTPQVHLEDRLHEMGVRVGYRILDLLVARDMGSSGQHRNVAAFGKKETRALGMLSFVSQVCWRALFGKPGDLLKSQDKPNEYMINDKNLVLNKYISVPKDMGQVNCGAYAAGIVEGILHSAEFPCEVSAHTVDDAPGVQSTTLLIRLAPEVMQRERKLAAG
uniref:Trafficking protein particle complex subunit n=1 Tax=Chromera velia CCMP2878 TaxID=1169474 RepID=A0A0G4I7P8_9ALVE|mmetsp:Transcript_50340/g.99128  ORF Transcript_50340/g.99128 Transcript_50340/m.99128 type:complete len:201 (+) Transcript_50340:466-1068(+)|eukprot:Cvel_11743.t1-p1 / transcript=Cvel_11743.t1 / gene=Cvel_11743 / organism=Chromera_velia_CCMP2878 / gene_product=Trafficking protein particle complex subunit 5, putative / transcript_product=Trafficking protein particle complex subunit 5, putative / location=Cvel_scaffold746:18772-21742(-) / protein_length=200 / sequence_SO=supercontig / SO=protein_coding / is_pseudo=false